MPTSWTPQIGVSFQWQLDGDIYSAPALVYDGDHSSSSFSPVDMHGRSRAAICYVNVGSLEDDSSVRADFSQFPASVIGNAYPGWDEKFLDTRSPIVRSLMQARFQAAANAGCDAIEPDNIDTYTSDTGFGLTCDDALEYVTWISKTVRGMGMLLADKNAIDLMQRYPQQMVELTDFAIIEECHATGTCALFAPYIAAGKPVYAVEYTSSGSKGGCDAISASQIPAACAELNSYNFEGLIKDCNLGSGWAPCQAYESGVRAGVSVDPAFNGGHECTGILVQGGGVEVNTGSYTYGGAPVPAPAYKPSAVAPAVTAPTYYPDSPASNAAPVKSTPDSYPTDAPAPEYTDAAADSTPQYAPAATPAAPAPDFYPNSNKAPVASPPTPDYNPVSDKAPAASPPAPTYYPNSDKAPVASPPAPTYYPNSSKAAAVEPTPVVSTPTTKKKVKCVRTPR
ncbi:hypothetical protein HK101_007258 [Irineochytrium annulatum]|nr:hypothetical protein HK101_007258 [Irineochytrium annulatum]